MMKTSKSFRMALLGLLLLVSVGCGTTTPAAPTVNPPTMVPSAVGTSSEQPPDAATSNAESPDPGSAQAVACEEYFRFCVTSTVSGAVNASATGGVGGNIDNCTAWAEEGPARILEVPMMLNSGEPPITVALTRIAAYTGPGEYVLQSVATGGAIPDMFPAMNVGARSFGIGEGSTARVTVAADGSGMLEATGLVEIASVQVSAPDPNARVDLTMQWICQEQ
ncbi:hypothetical protein EYB53_018960 [Candidatus Chloroploca sp. M-50]|uniref:Uncharacterized protein n=1 Tax=Candidatus Chloroploca mongolica TaxID=2528176 RepID=A0ABS4DEF1_9CHLR|nr:hypothetical protein [Candidatus Chloroploca mongolica]MBP1467803.1 hypothetical protein [Candidatus Chloroploca mongolica]